jgi:hypothetical protein
MPKKLEGLIDYYLTSKNVKPEWKKMVTKMIN